MVMKEIARYHNCFVCGDRNPTGIQARFFFDGATAHSDVTAKPAFEGYRGIYHGGVVSTLLDEIMVKSILALGVQAVTAEMTVRYIHPVRTGDKLHLSGAVTSHKGRLYVTEGQAVNGEGVVVATATGKYLEARKDLKAVLEQSFDQGE